MTLVLFQIHCRVLKFLRYYRHVYVQGFLLSIRKSTIFPGQLTRRGVCYNEGVGTGVERRLFYFLFSFFVSLGTRDHRDGHLLFVDVAHFTIRFGSYVLPREGASDAFSHRGSCGAHETTTAVGDDLTLEQGSAQSTAINSTLPGSNEVHDSSGSE